MPGPSPGWEKSVCAAALLLIRPVGKRKRRKSSFLARRGCACLFSMSLVSHWIE